MEMWDLGLTSRAVLVREAACRRRAISSTCSEGSALRRASGICGGTGQVYTAPNSNNLEMEVCMDLGVEERDRRDVIGHNHWRRLVNE